MRELASCLCPTMPGREADLARAVADFLAQDYAGPLELLVAVEAGHAPPLAAGTPGRAVRGVPVPAGLPLGPKRNALLHAARGSYCVQWDDDDRYHPERVRRQIEAILAEPRAVSSCLGECLYLDPEAAALHWVDWRVGPPAGTDGRMPGTIAHRKTDVRYAEEGPRSRKDEDTDFFQRLSRRGPSACLVGVPWLYLRTLHRTNNSGSDRMRRNLRVHAADPRRVVAAARALRDGVAAYAGLPGPLAVRAWDGVVLADLAGDSIADT